MKITAHKTFKNKFDQIPAGIEFIYCQNTYVIGSVLATFSFFHAGMQANVFSSEKTHQHIILFWREIHSFVSINDRNLTPSCPYTVSVFTIELVAHNLVMICFSDSKVSGTIAHKTVYGPFVQLIS